MEGFLAVRRGMLEAETTDRLAVLLMTGFSIAEQ